VPRLLRRQGAGDAHIEEKGLAVAVHTRRLADPDRTYDALLPALEELAARYDLVVEPGKQVIEVRSPGMHKGIVIERLFDELHAGGFVFVGDDLGDVEAFEAVAALAERGLPTLLVCSDSGEKSALARLSDVLVDGPDGVLDLLRQLTADAAALRA
jgi:trehalose 6-phosphate phosphatase